MSDLEKVSAVSTEVAETPRVTRERAFYEVTAVVATVTPELAARWLQFNDGNRSLQVKGAARYGRDMEAQEWALNGDTIKFDWFGNLLDGQHRLEAVVATGMSIQTIVVYGLDPEVMPTIDTGINRNFKNVLQFKHPGIRSPDTIAMLARRIYVWEPPHNERVDFSRVKPTHADLNRVMVNFPEIIPCVEFTEPLAKGTGLSKGMAAFVYWIFQGIDVEHAREFMLKLSTGANLPEHHPILLLRNRIIVENNAAMGKRRKIHTALLWYTVYAWNHWMNDNHITKLQLPNRDLRTVNFPRIASVYKRPEVVEEVTEG